MPAPVAYRRWDSGMQETLSPDVMYAPTARWAIIALGVVVAIVVLPVGTLPSLLTGQTAQISSTLQVGNTV